METKIQFIIKRVESEKGTRHSNAYLMTSPKINIEITDIKSNEDIEAAKTVLEGLKTSLKSDQ